MKKYQNEIKCMINHMKKLFEERNSNIDKNMEIFEKNLSKDETESLHLNL